MNLSKYKHIVCSLAAAGLLLVGLFLLLDGAPQIARADPGDLFVSPTGSGTACTQAAPCSLHTALACATGGDTIYAATGTYNGTGAAVVTVTQSITLCGGWDGAPTGGVVRDPDAHPTILNGEGQRRGVFITGDVTPTLDGFIVTDGSAAGLGGDHWGHDAGGGIYVRDAAAIVRNSRVFSNTAGRGGGLYLYTSPATLDGNTIFSNTGELSAGGVFLYNSAAGLSGNKVISNVAGGDGGGVCLMFADGATVVENTFSGNVAGAHGGGLYVSSSDVLFSRNVVTGNISHMRGGGLGMYASNAALDANTFISNTADEWGGGMFIYGGSPTLTNNIVTDNWAGVAGTGLYFWRSSARLLHNTIARNRGGDGSGICVSHWGTTYSNVVLNNTILVSHTLGITVSAGDIASLEGTLWGSGVWANGDDLGGEGTIFTGTVDLWDDPDFVNPVAWNYHIGPKSAAIDAGVDTDVDTDVDGDTRPWPAGGEYDIGADEARWRRVYLPLVLKSSG
jgi:hypothetical protein